MPSDAKSDAAVIFTNPDAYTDLQAWHAVAARLRREDPVCRVESARFEPFWAAAQETGALIFVHPTTTGFGLTALSSHYLWNSVGNPMETAVTAAHMASAGVLERHRELKILLAHGGGGLLAVRGRLRRAFAIRPEARSSSLAGPDASLRAFFYDSLTHDKELLAALIDYVGADRVLLGSDRPFDMGTEHPVEEIRALGRHDVEQLVLGENACRLLGLGR